MNKHDQTNVTVIADSVAGDTRITTLECYYPRIIHGEVMTHRIFSRNAQSSRACPTTKVLDAPVFLPVDWTANRKGMSAARNLSPAAANEADKVWLDMYAAVLAGTARLAELGVHKQHANRAIEPWTYIRVLITATDWDNFLTQRLSADAQPEIQVLARAVQAALAGSRPAYTQRHLPYYTQDVPYADAAMVCAARCARVSYGQFDGERDYEKDLALAERLWQDGHLSPFEHVACAAVDLPSRNLRGWNSYREIREHGC